MHQRADNDLIVRSNKYVNLLFGPMRNGFARSNPAASSSSSSLQESSGAPSGEHRYYYGRFDSLGEVKAYRQEYRKHGKKHPFQREEFIQFFKRRKVDAAARGESSKSTAGSKDLLGISRDDELLLRDALGLEGAGHSAQGVDQREPRELEADAEADGGKGKDGFSSKGVSAEKQFRVPGESLFTFSAVSKKNDLMDIPLDAIVDLGFSKNVPSNVFGLAELVETERAGALKHEGGEARAGGEAKRAGGQFFLSESDLYGATTSMTLVNAVNLQRAGYADDLD